MLFIREDTFSNLHLPFKKRYIKNPSTGVQITRKVCGDNIDPYSFVTECEENHPKKYKAEVDIYMYEKTRK